MISDMHLHYSRPLKVSSLTWWDWSQTSETLPNIHTETPLTVIVKVPGPTLVASLHLTSTLATETFVVLNNMGWEWDCYAQAPAEVYLMLCEICLLMHVSLRWQAQWDLRSLYLSTLHGYKQVFSTVFLHVPSITHMHVSAGGIYRIAGYFHGVLIIVIFVVHLGVTKFSTHEICVVLSTHAQI